MNSDNPPAGDGVYRINAAITRAGRDGRAQDQSVLLETLGLRSEGERAAIERIIGIIEERRSGYIDQWGRKSELDLLDGLIAEIRGGQHE